MQGRDISLQAGRQVAALLQILQSLPATFLQFCTFASLQDIAHFQQFFIVQWCDQFEAICANSVGGWRKTPVRVGATRARGEFETSQIRFCWINLFSYRPHRGFANCETFRDFSLTQNNSLFRRSLNQINFRLCYVNFWPTNPDNVAIYVREWAIPPLPPFPQQKRKRGDLWWQLIPAGGKFLHLRSFTWSGNWAKSQVQSGGKWPSSGQSADASLAGAVVTIKSPPSSPPCLPWSLPTHFSINLKLAKESQRQISFNKIWEVTNNRKKSANYFKKNHQGHQKR